MKKGLACMASMLFCISALAACGNTNDNDSSNNTAETTSKTVESTTDIVVDNSTTEETDTTLSTEISTTEPSASDKLFNVSGCGITLYLDTNWDLTSGGTDNGAYATIDDSSATISYKDTGDFLSLTITDGSETEEAFAANTVDSYIEAYGSQYYSIDVTSFENIEIDYVPSFKVCANVVVNDIEYKMLHIISNSTAKDRTINIILFDSSGSIEPLFDDFVENSIAYSGSLANDVDSILGEVETHTISHDR